MEKSRIRDKHPESATHCIRGNFFLAVTTLNLIDGGLDLGRQDDQLIGAAAEKIVGGVRGRRAVTIAVPRRRPNAQQAGHVII
jgi:hypothetical protein